MKPLFDTRANPWLAWLGFALIGVALALLPFALAQVGRLLLPLLEELTEDDPWLLLEPTAGQGFSLCSLVQDLGPYFEILRHHPRLGVCLDTCHVFAAGHDLAAPGGVKPLPQPSTT